MRHPTVEAVLAIHREVLAAHGGREGVRSRELLESAVAAPQASMGGAPFLTDPLEIAAAYLHYLCSNHPFVDGNKRVALATCLVFLDEHGLLPDSSLEVDAWEALILQLASGALSRSETTAAVRQLLGVVT